MIGYDWLFVGFFCKQNTAYEMRMSDWSSDVCSSDLLAPLFHHLVGEGRALAEIDDRVDRARVVDMVVGDRRGVAGARGRVREHLVFQRGRRHARGEQLGDAQVLVADRALEVGPLGIGGVFRGIEWVEGKMEGTKTGENTAKPQ